MGISKKPNRKRKPRGQKRKKTHRDTLAKIKTLGITTLLLAIACFGLWRCLGEESGAVLTPYDSRRSSKVVDVGKGKKPDPTIVNEQQLLISEVPAPQEAAQTKMETPSSSPEEEAAATPAPEQASEGDSPVDPFPKYAVAFHFHTQIWSAPSRESRAIAYARRGATFRAGEIISRKGCDKGWHEIAPGDLFACNGEGILVGDVPQTFAPSPPAANMESPLPYKYSYVTADNTPQYWRIPTDEERDTIADLFERQENPGAPDGGPREPDAKVVKDAGADKDAGNDKNVLPPYVYQKMNRGYYVSIDDRPSYEENNTYQSTVRGRFLPSSRLASAKPSPFSGILLGQKHSLPLVYVVGSGVSLLRQLEENGPLNKGAPAKRMSLLPFLGETKRRNRTYVQVGNGLFLSSRVAAVIKTSEPPADLQPGERWIDINLTEQTLVAYEGEKPVFATLVSSGREEFPTPEGLFRIYSKHVSITMDNPAAGLEAYSIEDVPWTQYFKDSYAIHAAFWHNRFGRPKSHGCINLAPKDAHRLFLWTGPHLSRGLHGVSASRENNGTRISIHK